MGSNPEPEASGTGQPPQVAPLPDRQEKATGWDPDDRQLHMWMQDPGDRSSLSMPPDVRGKEVDPPAPGQSADTGQGTFRIDPLSVPTARANRTDRLLPGPAQEPAYVAVRTGQMRQEQEDAAPEIRIPPRGVFRAAAGGARAGHVSRPGLPHPCP